MLDEIQQHDTYIENVSWKIRSKRAVMVLFAANNIVETMFYCFRPFQRVFCCIAFELFVDFFVACNLHNKSIVYITIQSNTSSLGMQMLLWVFRNILYFYTILFSLDLPFCVAFLSNQALFSLFVFLVAIYCMQFYWLWLHLFPKSEWNLITVGIDIQL